MLSENSVFRKLPHGLSKDQIVFLDALRVSAEIAQQSYDELLAELREFSKKDHLPGKRNFVTAIRHTWTVVDAVHRFRVVLQQAPRIKHNHVYELFMRRTKAVTEMRNTAQHLNQRLQGIAKRSQGAYGTLTWIVGAGQDQVQRPFMLNIGTAYGRVVGPVVDFEERLPVGEIRRIRLELADRFLLLSDTQESLASMIRSLEGALSSVAEGKERFGSDQLMGFDFVPVSEDRKDI